MKQIRIENGIILYYGNRAGRVTKGCAVVDPMFQGPELEGFLRKQTSIQEIQWKDGIFDRLTAGAVDPEISQGLKDVRVWQLKGDVDVQRKFIDFALLVHQYGPPQPYDYEYRTNTEVITAVEVSGGQSDPDDPVSVTFSVGGKGYRVDHVYYPSGDSQLAWIRWTTPKEPQTMMMTVRVHGGGRTEKGTLNIKIVDLDENPPPDPNADDRNDGFTRPSVPSKAEVTSAVWGVWRPWWQEHWVWHSGDEEDDGYWCDHGWWEFDLDRYSASLAADMRITTDEKSPTATERTMKSGYGFQEKVITHVSTNQSFAVTPAQNAVTYFPEFQYEKFWRLLERMNGGYDMTHEFKENGYSTYRRRTHFTPIWYPDGSYTPYTWLLDCWTPAGMLSMNLTDSITIDGNLWSDWHIAPQKPE